MPSRDFQTHETARVIVTGVARDYAAGETVAPHRHDRCQLLYAIDGVLRVETPAGRWVVLPSRAVWLRPGVEHRLRMRGPVRVRSVFVDARRARGLPAEDGVIPVSPLLRALIAELARLGLAAEDTRRGRLLAALLREELRAPMDLAFHLPWPAEGRMAPVCAALMDDGPGRDWEAGRWARELAMSLKTFHRHFRRQTGLSFGQWRLRARLLSSLQGLVGGQPILHVALACGYESHSAYTLAFRRQFGMAPSAFVALREPDSASASGWR